jgi:DNA-binding HxlR family transcriptional regulator
MEYQPTEKGNALKPVLHAMYAWGERFEPTGREKAAAQ